VFPSLCDPFDNQVPARWRHDFWHRIDQTPHLDWLLLTKRPQNIAKMLPDPSTGVKPWGNGWPNVWFGVSAGNQEEANRNIPILLATPAVVRFASLEPLLGPITLKDKWLHKPLCYCCPGGKHIALDLVIAGGESGPKARPMHPDRPRALRDQCQGAGVPFFFNQWGDWAPDDYCRDDNGNMAYGHWHGNEFVQSCLCSEGSEPVFRFGKHLAGRRLDGRTWDEMPETGQQPQRQAGSDPVADRPHQDATMRVTP
jgi:protein gp37